MAINIPIISSLNTKGFDSAKKEFQSLQGFGAKSGFLLKQAMVPAAGAVSALAGGLAIAAKAAMEDERSSKLLETQLRATLGPNQALVDSVADFVDKTQLATGVADDELRPALAGLVRFTKDASKAQDLLTLSIDASKATGKDLAAVSTAIGRAYDGNFTALKKLGVPLDENIIKTKDFKAAQEALTMQFGGAAAANASTYSGRLQILKVRFDEMVEAIGYRVLPKLGQLLDYVDKLIKIMDDRGLGGVISELGTKLKRFIDPATALSDVLKKNTSDSKSFLDNMKQGGVNAANFATGLVNLGGKVIGLDINIGKLKTDTDKLNETFANAYTNTKAWSDVLLQLDQDQKRANYQKAVDIEQQRLANLEIAKSTASTKKATEAAKKAAEATSKHAESVRLLKEAYDNAVQTVKDKFAPALMRANKQLTDATDNYNNFYNATKDVVAGIFNIGEAWTSAADSEGAQTFFGNLEAQANKASELATGIEQLIAAGLDDPALLQSILASGADVGLEIIKSLLAGGKASIDKLVGISTTINAAADRIAKLTADKWFKSGVDQAQAIVNGVNSVIDNTEFLLKFALSPESVALISEGFNTNIGRVTSGMAPDLSTNPFGPVLGSINTSTNADMSRYGVGKSSVNVTVNAGLVSTPDQIGQDIITAIQKAQRRSGQVFANAKGVAA
jgi:hypothetical protein